MKTLPRLYLALFFLSGLAGLVHETVWARYLGILLGHSAFGQILTLSVYMGGIGIGSFLASRWIKRIRKPLRAYAYVEFGIALGGFLFHDLFVLSRATLLDSGVLAGSSQATSTMITVALGVALTLPWAILLGATYPLATAGLMRLQADGGRDSIARLYFANSIGAAMGALANSFVFIPSLGTSGSLAIAGVINGLVGLVSLGGARFEQETRPKAEPPAEIPPPGSRPEVPAWLLLILAAATGFSSFLYEVGWTRLLGLLLGSSTHAFDLMISAFIIGLAFGSLHVHRRAGRGPELALLFVAQASMAGCAVLSVLGYHWLFEMGNALNSILQRSPEAYTLRVAIQYGISILVMAPTAFFAGMTLPLITGYLCRNGDESYTGRVYGWNTMGAISGALLGGLVLMPGIGLTPLIAAGGLVDLGLALLLLPWLRARPRHFVLLASAASLVLLAFLVRPDNHVLSSGTYRGLRSLEAAANDTTTRLDGRSATISFRATPDRLSIATNGKTDASISRDRTKLSLSDELTQDLLAWTGRPFLDSSYDAALIGFGSGMTAHRLLEDRQLGSLDMIEIEPAIWTLAKGFQPFNRKAYDDPRARIHFEDARIFFARTGRKYDLIVSEPSNPWVSGVASLFTTEYYAELRDHLSERGVLVQWLHLYEFNDTLLLSVLGSVHDNFRHIRFLPVLNKSDVIILASSSPLEPRRSGEDLWSREELKDMGIYGLQPNHIPRALEIFTERTLPWIASETPRNSEFFPIVENEASRAFFSGARSTIVPDLLPYALSPLEGIEDFGFGGRFQDLLFKGEESNSPLSRLQLSEEFARLPYQDTLRVNHFLRTRMVPHAPPTRWGSDTLSTLMARALAFHLDSSRVLSERGRLFLFQWAARMGDPQKAEMHRVELMKGPRRDFSEKENRDLLIASLRTGATGHARLLLSEIRRARGKVGLDLALLEKRIVLDSIQQRRPRTP